MQIFLLLFPGDGSKIEIIAHFLFFDIEFPEKDEYNRCVNYLVR